MPEKLIDGVLVFWFLMAVISFWCLLRATNELSEIFRPDEYVDIQSLETKKTFRSHLEDFAGFCILIVISTCFWWIIIPLYLYAKKKLA